MIAFFIFGLAVANDGSSTVTVATCYAPAFTISLGVKDPDGTAWAEFDDQIQTQGWSKLYVHINPNAGSDSQAMKCAGMVEGALTVSRMEQYIRLFRYGFADSFGRPVDDAWPPELVDWMTRNRDWTYQQVSLFAGQDRYWEMMQLILSQHEGLFAGYEMFRTSDDVKLTDWEAWTLQAAGDMDDLATIVFLDKPDFETRYANRRTDEWHELHNHCSALVRLLPDWSDLYIGHDTWSGFTDMMRILKEYHFPLSNPYHKSEHLLISSYPGQITSVDDWWMSSAGLLITETSLNIWNMSLYKDYCTPESVQCWLRSDYASRVSLTGEQWTREFIRYNSGTYNNQYFVIDYKLFRPHVRVQKDLFWMLEQVPGPGWVREDKTKQLYDVGFEPGMNTPSFPAVYDIAGYNEKVAEDGTGYWSYWDNSRMKAFQRDAPGISSKEDFQKIMRQNNWPNDPLLLDDPGTAILSRYDLRYKSTINRPANAFGGFDTKTTSWKDCLFNMKFDFISSPQHETQDAWEFGEPPFEDVPYDGLPKRWDFDWTSFEPQTKPCSQKHCTDCKEFGNECAWCSTSMMCDREIILNCPDCSKVTVDTICPDAARQKLILQVVGGLLLVPMILVGFIVLKKKVLSGGSVYQTLPLIESHHKAYNGVVG